MLAAVLGPVAACAAPAGPTPEPTAASAPAAAPTPTSAPKPTDVPKPTEAPKPTVAPSPTAEAKPTTAVTPERKPMVMLSSTIGPIDAGIVGALEDAFTKKTGIPVRHIGAGTGATLEQAKSGRFDIVMVHARSLEDKFVADGFGVDRRDVMYNDFVILGPAADPAKIKGEKSAAEALKKIAEAQAIFVSRGDNSGTHQLENKLWGLAKLDPKGQQWYQQTGQGMGATLNVAAEKAGYTISDRATYLANQKNVKLEILVEGDGALLNVYHVITVNPKKSDKINAEGAKAFADFMVAKETQDVIAKFGVDKYGQPLFFPDADKKDSDLGL